MKQHCTSSIRIALGFVLVAMTVIAIVMYCRAPQDAFALLSPDSPGHKETLKQVNFIDPSVIGSGTITKYISDDVHHYIYKFDVPIVHGGAYSTRMGKYVVFADNEKVGELERSGDGWHYLLYKTSQPIKTTRIERQSSTPQEGSVVLWEKSV